MNLKSVVQNLEEGNLNHIKGLTFESLIFLLQQHRSPVCILTSSFCVEAASLLFQEKIGDGVGCISSKQPGSIETINQHFFASSISIQMLATQPKKASLVFIEEGLFKKPLIPIQKPKTLVVSSKTTFNKLLSGLASLGFLKTKGAIMPGTFLVRGGTVDLFLFNINRAYRISFLEDDCRIFSISLQNNKIIKEFKSLNIFSKAQQNKVSLFSAPGLSFCFYKYKNKELTLNGFEKNKKKLDLNCLNVDYQSFISKKTPLYTSSVFLNSFFERGFIYQKKLYAPKWFQKKPKKIKGASSPLEVFGALEAGATYIHDDFGFCMFLGFEKTKKEEKACLKFADGVVKININYISKLSFVSHDNKKLSFLNKLSLWKKRKNTIEKRAEEFVGSLVKAYSKREGATSPSLEVKDDIINTFVNSFPYKDTPDQLLCWQDILKDLGSALPMNRLICGDVGFGKTELAIRASFVSVVNKQQVVLVAPTTILANQLYHCFNARLCDFGVFIGCLSRVVQKKDVVINSFKKKKIDILIGTSSILFQKDILKQCGLFIVDEEHRFGVEKKEKVFQYNPSVNFLSLSATPIPRSMQLSLSGVRNFSLIQTPPIARKPIISSLHYFSTPLVKNIILKEISRGGQVFFVDNSVNNLKRIFKELSLVLPFLNMDVVYGSLEGSILIKKMEAFVKQKTQVLFSTTIIESGIDIGSTNTIIINNAHLFGLSQLYQLKGRVGRSSSQAFAWFLFSKNKRPTDRGLARLKTIIQHTSLGSGYKVALSDLEIRGAGSLFGYNQSGGGGVGFEYYSKMLARVVNKTSGGRTTECLVDLFNPSIPESFLSNEKDRAFYYKKIFSCSCLEDLKKIKEDVVSMFGVSIKEINLLIQNKSLSLLGNKKNISRISKKQNIVSVYFSIKKTDPLVDSIVPFVYNFFTKKGLDFWFLKSHKNLIFQYKSLEKDDYILLSSFINKI